MAHQFAAGLLELGFAKGDKIMTVTNNRPQWNFVDMGMSMAGLIHVPVYTSMNAEEYAYIMDHSDAKMVIVSDQRLYEIIEPVFNALSKATHLYTFDQIEGARLWTEVLDKGKAAGSAIREQLDSIKHEISPADVVSIIYTSGTTGRSKGVMLSHKTWSAISWRRPMSSSLPRKTATWPSYRYAMWAEGLGITRPSIPEPASIMPKAWGPSPPT